MDFLLWTLNVAWKILVLCIGWMLFKYIVKNGSGTFREFLDTVSIALRTIGHGIRKVCLNYLRKEESEAESKVQRRMTNAGDQPLSYEEYCKAVGWHCDGEKNPPTIE